MVENAHTYPMPRHVTVLRFLSGLLGRTAIVCAALSGILLVFGIVIEEAALPLEYDTASGLDDYLRVAVGVIALGGGFGVAIVLGLVHDLYRRAQLKALDQIVENHTGRLPGPPVEWQRKALEDSGMGSGLLSWFSVVLGPIVVIAAIVMLLDDPDDGFTTGVLAVGVVLTVLGFFGVRSMLRTRHSPAIEKWGGATPPLHRLEPPRRRDSDGDPITPSRRELAAAFRGEVAHPALRRLVRLDRVAGIVMTVSTWLLLVASLATVAVVLVRQPCRECDARRFGEGVEGAIDVALLVTLALMAAGLTVLVITTVLDAVVVLRLRHTVLDIAADADAERPPWFLLRRVLLEESPLQDLTGHLHTLAVICLGLGLTGRLTGDTHPMDAWSTQFEALLTVGGILLLFHCSAWFWKRDQTLRENHMLMARWPA